MTWLTVTENLCNKWTHICSICRTCHPILFSFMIYHFVCNKTNMADATCRLGNTHPTRVLEFTSDVRVVRVASSLVFCAVFCRSCLLCFIWPLYYQIYRKLSINYLHVRDVLSKLHKNVTFVMKIGMYFNKKKCRHLVKLFWSLEI